MKGKYSYWFVLAIMLCFSSTVFGQLVVNPGVKGGINYVTLRTNIDAAQLESKLGFHGGFFVMVTPVPTFTFQVEALFTQRGAKQSLEGEINGIPFDATFDYSINYIEIPLLGKVNLPVGNTLQLNLLAGPAFSIKLSEKVELDGQDLETDDDLNPTDLGVVFGAGGTMKPTAGPQVTVDIRFVLGLSDIADVEADETDPTQEVATLKNSAIMATLGIAL